MRGAIRLMALVAAGAVLSAAPAHGQRIRDRIEQRRAGVASGEERAQRDVGAPTAPGTYERNLLVDGRARSYVLHLPTSYDGRHAMPMVLVLHGGGGSADGTDSMTGFTAKSDAAGFILVYPNGTGPMRNRFLTWNSGVCCGYALENNVDDVTYFRALLDRAEHEVRVDPARVYVTGFSNGAMMSYRLACELSDRFAAVAPVAGALDIDCAPSSPVPMVIFHGTADQNVPYNGGSGTKSLDPHPRVDKSVSYAVSFWAQRDGCAASPSRSTHGSIVTDSYGGCKPGTDVVLYAINGQGHAWPGGQKWAPRADEPTHEISATDTIWEFFSKHHR